MNYDDLVKRCRDHATDWNGEQMPDLEPAKSDPTAGTMRACADAIERLQAELALAKIDVGIQECLAVSEYKAGVKLGWNLGDNREGLVQATEGTEHIAELNRLKAERAAIRQRTGANPPADPAGRDTASQ